jgi:hypothetical protein
MTEQKNNNNSNATQPSSFTLVRQENGIAHLVMVVVGESINTLKALFVDEFASMLAEIRDDNTIRGLVLLSGKANSFVAGADINMLADCQTTEQATAISKQGQIIFDRIEQLTVPVVAAINGVCLGGSEAQVVEFCGAPAALLTRLTNGGGEGTLRHPPAMNCRLRTGADKGNPTPISCIPGYFIVFTICCKGLFNFKFFQGICTFLIRQSN